MQTGSLARRHVRPRRVGDLLTARFAKLPDWFTVGAALRVARLKGVDHLLVVDRGAVVGVAEARVLEGAPERDPLSRWTPASRATLTPETPIDEARRLMAAQGVASMPVTSGALLVGIVTLAALARAGA